MRGQAEAARSNARQTARLIRLLFVLQCISMGAMEMSGPFWPVHLRAMSPSDAVFGFAGIAVYVGPMLGIVLTSTFWGRLGDRYGHKPMMVRALAALCLTQLALAWAQDVWSILALRFLQAPAPAISRQHRPMASASRTRCGAAGCSPSCKSPPMSARCSVRWPAG